MSASDKEKKVFFSRLTPAVSVIKPFFFVADAQDKISTIFVLGNPPA
jgi:hypothetical protein